MLRSSILRSVRPQAVRCAALRSYSSQAPALADVDPSKMVIQSTTAPRALMKEEELVFGRSFTGTALFPGWTCF